MSVYINGRKAVHAASNAMLRTDDLCHVKGSVVCFTNIALSCDAADTATTVFANENPLCHQQSCFAKSSGDEPSDGGIHSGSTQGKAIFTSASSDVFIEGIPAVRIGDSMISNNGNTAESKLT